MVTQKERENFLITLCKELPSRTQNEVLQAGRLLLRHAKTHGNIQEAVCNGPGDYVNRVPYPQAGEIYREHEARCEKREKQIEARIEKIASSIGLKASFGGDPRGLTVSLHFPSGKYNTLGGEESGYGVPQ